MVYDWLLIGFSQMVGDVDKQMSMVLDDKK